MKLSRYLTLGAVILSTKSWAQVANIVSLDQLKDKYMDEQTISYLIAKGYLVPTSNPKYVILNDSQIEKEISLNKDQKVRELISWVKNYIKPDIKINLKNPSEMVLATQDIKGSAKGVKKGQ